MTQIAAQESALPAQPVSALRIVTQLFLGALALILAVNLLANVQNLLLYVHKLFDEQPDAYTRLTTNIHVLVRSYLVFAIVIMASAAARLSARFSHLAVFAQVVAIINSFGIIALWGFNAYTIAQNQMRVELSASALLQSGALLLANILTACMLSEIIRQKKAALATPPRAVDQIWSTAESLYVFYAFLYLVPAIVALETGMVLATQEDDLRKLHPAHPISLNIPWTYLSLVLIVAGALGGAALWAAWSARRKSPAAVRIGRWIALLSFAGLLGLSIQSLFGTNAWGFIYNWSDTYAASFGLRSLFMAGAYLVGACISIWAIWASGDAQDTGN